MGIPRHPRLPVGGRERLGLAGQPGVLGLRQQLDEPVPRLEKIRALADEGEEPLDGLVRQAVLGEDLGLHDQGLLRLLLRRGARRRRLGEEQFGGRRRPIERARRGGCVGENGRRFGSFRRLDRLLFPLDRGHVRLRCVDRGRLLQIDDELLVFRGRLLRRGGGSARLAGRRTDVLEPGCGRGPRGIGLQGSLVVLAGRLRIVPLLRELAERRVGLGQALPVALRLLDLGQLLERRDVARIGREDGLEVVGRLREVAPRDRAGDERRDDLHRLVEGLLLHAHTAQEQTRRFRIRVQGQGLLGGPNRIRTLPHLQLGLGKQGQALGGAGSRLENRHGGVGVLLREQRANQVLLRFHVVGRQLERLLKDLRGLVVGAALQQHRSDQAVLHHGLVLLIRRAVEVRQPDLDSQVAGIDRGHLLVDRDRVLQLVVLLIVIGEDLVLAPGILDEPLLVVQLGELVVDLELGRVDLVDLLVDRDRLQEEAVLRIEVGDAREIGDRFAGPVHPDVEVPDLVQRGDVLGVVLQHAQVLLERLIELAPGEKLLGGLEDLFSGGRHLGEF